MPLYFRCMLDSSVSSVMVYAQLCGVHAEVHAQLRIQPAELRCMLIAVVIVLHVKKGGDWPDGF